MEIQDSTQVLYKCAKLIEMEIPLIETFRLGTAKEPGKIRGNFTAYRRMGVVETQYKKFTVCIF